MNAQQIQTRLEEMKGNTFVYAKARHEVISYIISGSEEKFTINTDKNSFVRKFESAPEFFKHWEVAKPLMPVAPVTRQEVAAPEPAISPEVLEKENNLADQMVDILMDNIAKVKKDAGYIKQAQSINNNVNSILHVQKLKMEIARNSRKR